MSLRTPALRRQTRLFAAYSKFFFGATQRYVFFPLNQILHGIFYLTLACKINYKCLISKLFQFSFPHARNVELPMLRRSMERARNFNHPVIPGTPEELHEALLRYERYRYF